MDAPSKTTTYDQCARELYETSKQTGEPGTVYSYNSIHLQLAGAVALHATGLTDIQTALSRYLFEPYGMANTTCATPSETVPQAPGRAEDADGSRHRRGVGPGYSVDGSRHRRGTGRGYSVTQVAVCLETTGADYERFLARTLSHSVLPAALVRESEKDATPFLANDYTLYGDYAFGHFLECFDSVEGFTDARGTERKSCPSVAPSSGAGRGPAAGATWIFRGGGDAAGCHVDRPRDRVVRARLVAPSSGAGRVPMSLRTTTPAA